MQHSDNLQQSGQSPDVQPPSQKKQIDWETGSEVQQEPSFEIVPGYCSSVHNEDLNQSGDVL